MKPEPPDEMAGTTRGDSWVPPTCSLPTAEQPLRVAEFDDFFIDAVRGADRVAPTKLRLKLIPDAEIAKRAGGLIARETDCCSFFTFVITAGGDGMTLDIQVPDAYTHVLDALAARVAADTWPDALEGSSEAFRKRRTGKSTFSFPVLNDEMATELDAFLERLYQRYRQHHAD
ncbi:hypothetical protein [Nocardioides sp.]|uniref:hypothetical protein n=1 Tax=Nocardioides sp. TaxID=35761 RepID=UPI0025CFFE96|nr:hypothetical protein [Nocardioides sp.]